MVNCTTVKYSKDHLYSDKGPVSEMSIHSLKNKMLSCDLKNIIWVCVTSCIVNAVLNLVYLKYFYQHPQFHREESISTAVQQQMVVYSKVSTLLFIIGVMGLIFLNHLFLYIQTDPYNKIFFKTIRFVLLSIFIVMFIILSILMCTRLQLVNNTKKVIQDFTKSHWQLTHDLSLRIPVETQKKLALENLVILVLTTVLATPVVLALMTLPRKRYRDVQEKQRVCSPTLNGLTSVIPV